MSKKPQKEKQLSNPVSTGGGGVRFETIVQAFFVACMLTDGSIPCLHPGGPIISIEFQCMKSGHRVDDCVITARSSNEDLVDKLHAQIKRDVTVSKTNKTFFEVIAAALADFRSSSFNRGRDAIALVTGPLSQTIIRDVRTMLDRARHSSTAAKFFEEIAIANYTSDGQREKLAAFRTQLKKANGGKDLDEIDTFEFLKSFHIIGYDVEGTTHSSAMYALLASNLRPFGITDPHAVLSVICMETSSYNQNGGTLTIDSIPRTISSYFQTFAKTSRLSASLLNEASDGLRNLSDGETGEALVYASILGSWLENNEGDQEIIKRLIGDG